MKLDDHKLLAETGAGTAMGNFLRRYWMPAILGRELEVGGAPVRVRLLGEDLIAFRNTEGKVGLFGERCAHRGASLFLAKNADCKLRCWYHGWQYDLDGNCTDQPNEPPQTQFKQHVKQKAYPCIEKNGVVWTYLGPKETRPSLPDLEWLTVPETHVYVSKRLQRCHWTQGMEGDLDSAHLSILHNDLLKQRAANPRNRSAVWAMRELQPEIKTEAMPNGLLLAAKRAAELDTCYWRVNQWFMPFFTNWPIPGDNPQAGHAWVPIDDTQCWVFTFSWHPARPLREDELALDARRLRHPRAGGSEDLRAAAQCAKRLRRAERGQAAPALDGRDRAAGAGSGDDRKHGAALRPHAGEPVGLRSRCRASAASSDRGGTRSC